MASHSCMIPFETPAVDSSDKCLTTTFGKSEHIPGNADFVVYNRKSKCFSYDGGECLTDDNCECKTDTMCEVVSWKCRAKAQYMSKGLGSVEKTGWGKGAKRHALNIYVRTKTGADTSPGAAASGGGSQNEAGDTNAGGANAPACDASSCQNGGLCQTDTGRCLCAAGLFAGQECTHYLRQIHPHQNLALFAPAEASHAGFDDDTTGPASPGGR